MRIGVDIDGVVVNTPDIWKQYLENVCGMKLGEPPFSYNLCDEFQGALSRLSIDGYEWWRQGFLYDNLRPLEGCVDALRGFYEKGHEIVFISALKGNHHKSKVEFIKKFFPFYSAFLGTKEKGYVDVDVMIDDRLDNLYQFPDHVLKVLYLTDYKQSEQLRDDVVIVRDWESVKWVLTGASVNV